MECTLCSKQQLRLHTTNENSMQNVKLTARYHFPCPKKAGPFEVLPVKDFPNVMQYAESFLSELPLVSVQEKVFKLCSGNVPCC